MLVRLKKRGEFPSDHGGGSTPSYSVSGVRMVEVFRGMTIEVEPSEISFCGQWFAVTDSRWKAIKSDDSPSSICEHCLIDDLNAYDSDANDEEAGIGDLALADCKVMAEVKR